MLMIVRKHQISASQRGIATVEMAIVLPLFGILLLGIFEIGGITRDYQVLQNGAREGARFAALATNRTSGLSSAEIAVVQTTIKNRIISYLANEKITVAASDITVNQAYPIVVGSVTATGSQVIITYNRPLVFSGITKWFTPGTTFQGKATFKNFY